jgi:hypothetical protein
MLYLLAKLERRLMKKNIVYDIEMMMNRNKKKQNEFCYSEL